MISIEAVEQYFLTLQKTICHQLELTDGKKKFFKDHWHKPDGTGYGRTYVLENGGIFEQAGVNFSKIKGTNMPKSATVHRPELTGRDFEAMGVSLVLHPFNPFVPTVHMNVRFFIASHQDKNPIWWFGGGFDLTPYYGFTQDAIDWHENAKKACLPFGKQVYPDYKNWCDEYFYLKHRDEPRGIGGLFFDDLNQGGLEQCFAFIQSIGNAFLTGYLPIVHRRKDMPYTQQNIDWQHYRRGRYVEFNLVYDRGTLFGLQSGGRTESILMSLPPKVCWHYDYKPKKDSQEEALYTNFLIKKDWLDF